MILVSNMPKLKTLQLCCGTDDFRELFPNRSDKLRAIKKLMDKSPAKLKNFVTYEADLELLRLLEKSAGTLETLTIHKFYQ